MRERKSLRDNAPDSNVFSEMMRRINSTSDESLNNVIFYEPQKNDHRFGVVGTLTVRTLVFFYQLHREAEGMQGTLHSETRHERLANLIDETELEAEFVLNFYLQQLRFEPELQEWKGLPLYTLRKEGDDYIAVIRPQDRASYQKHVKQRPYSEDRLYRIFRRIAIESVKEMR